MKTKKSEDRSRWVSGDQFQFHTPKTPQLKKGRRNTHHGGILGKQQNSLQKHMTNRTTYVHKSEKHIQFSLMEERNEKHMRSRVVLKRLEGSIQSPRKRVMSGGDAENTPKKTKQDRNADEKVKNEASGSFSLNGSRQEGINASPKRVNAGKSPSPKGSAKAKKAISGNKAGSSQKKAAAKPKKRTSTPKSPRTPSPKKAQKEKSPKSSDRVSRPRRSVVRGLQVSESKETQSSTSRTTPKRHAASKNEMFDNSLTHEITGWEEVSKYEEEGMEIDGNLVSKDSVTNGKDETDTSLKPNLKKGEENLEVGTEARETSSSWSCSIM